MLFANSKIVIFVFNASVFHRFQCFRRKSKNNRLIAAMMFMRFSIFCHVYKLVFILIFAHTILLWMTSFYPPNFSVQKSKIVSIVFDYNEIASFQRLIGDNVRVLFKCLIPLIYTLNPTDKCCMRREWTIIRGKALREMSSLALSFAVDI